MRNVIRISPTVPPSLTPHAVTGSPSSQKPCSKLKPKSRQVLTGIANLVVPRASENDDTLNNIVSIPPTRRAFYDVRVPGPFLRIRHVQKGCLSEVIAVHDMNGGRKLGGRVLCLKRFVKAEVTENRAHRIILQELQAYKAMSLAGGEWLPFVMRLDALLEDASCLYFAMDFMDCDLLDVLANWSASDLATYKKRWVAQIATGISAIHSAGILHRDIKPENILIDFQRNVRIADFGCAFLNDENKSLHRYREYCVEFCGTWPYQAPEILANEGKAYAHRRKYGIGVDYWALGCIIFELELDGTRTLFETKADVKVYERYRPSFHHGESYLHAFPLSAHAEDLILGLIRLSPTRRFGKEICRHPYFQTTNGVSEFKNIEAPNELTVDGVPEARVSPDRDDTEIYCPTPYDPSDEEPTEISFDNYCWINPVGIWGT